MRLTIIPSDKAVYVNGSVITGLIFSSPGTVRALQWKESSGWIEYTDGGLNEQINALPQWAVDAVAARTKAVADALEAANAPPTAEQLAEQALREKHEADATAAKADAKLTALGAMSPAQVRAWVAANVTNLADAKDVLGTLAVAVSILSRRL